MTSNRGQGTGKQPKGALPNGVGSKSSKGATGSTQTKTQRDRRVLSSTGQIKEIEFLHAFPVYDKVLEGQAKGKEFLSTLRIPTKKVRDICRTRVQVEVASD